MSVGFSPYSLNFLLNCSSRSKSKYLEGVPETAGNSCAVVGGWSKGVDPDGDLVVDYH